MKTPAFLEKLKKHSIVSIVRVGCIVSLFVMLVILTVQGREKWYIALVLSLGLLTAFGANFLVKKLAVKSVIYAAEYVILLVYSVLFEAGMLSTIYSLILVDFYLNNSLKSNAVFGGLSYLAFAVSITVRDFVFNPEWASVAGSLAVAINEFIIFSLVFTIANMLNAIVKKTAEAEKNLEEVYAREKKLQEANEHLKEAAKLEERNRIAKQIHDTTGHSITTIIMQTEAAKLLFDADPEGAKRKIVSANLQAISALEELRKSVRVLSGEYTPFHLAASLEKAINETTEGTDIAIRAKTEDIDVDENTAFFLYSSLKEGLNNGIRHGNSTAFLFELKIRDGKVRFLLSDNGTGAKECKEGYGLRTMREGAEKLGGTAEFYTAEGEGMEIRITLPANGKGEGND
ncbi:MAG: hypothetical protein DBX59_04625 [Bacillota bacterium]|nr:MAG: hypothetical protein DBX59_04625 [Bacillota bacterium]